MIHFGVSDALSKFKDDICLIVTGDKPQPKCFCAVSATMLPLRRQSCARSIGACLDCLYPLLFEKHYPKLSNSKSDISYLTT
ncbi:hypothetical protein Y032_0021g366 [Ancylostoma ceylanicum]|uniref:Uncharacterized protein n=1 Tax=Ancylostoma ceylanicum TaxID=53326 RepID=A0A016V1S9_9BILA|nr:hypothetical protein Y032_0021g366 [Ancylostoma ceylanicum]